MNIIKPKKLKQGATIGIIAPSGTVDIEKVEKAKLYFENKGYKVKLGSNITKQERYLAGCDEDRLSDLHNAFQDPEIDAIVCARGGYGASRLINKIDYELIKQNPKIFCGYSDITVLNAMFFKNCGLVTFSGPMAQSDFAEDKVDEYTEKEFFNTLTNSTLKIEADDPYLYCNGEIQGITFGGNLSTLASICGVDFIPDEKFIFFAEDLNEPSYKIDRYFTQLLNIEKFHNNVGAIVLGDFLDAEEPWELDEFFKELAKNLNIPIVAGFPITHDETKATVPYGAIARLQDSTLSFENFTI